MTYGNNAPPSLSKDVAKDGTRTGDEDRRIEIRKTWDEMGERNEIYELMR